MRTHWPLLSALGLAALVALTTGLVQGSGEVRAPLHDPATTTGRLQNGEPEGRRLYLQSCASCHGAEGEGTSLGPSLVGVGAASADFQLTTGRMPFAGPPGSQARRKPPAFSAEQIDALVAYVASLGPGPEIPEVTVSEELVPRGAQVYFGNCAPCHGATGNGGAVGGGALAPPLDRATPVQVAEAMLTGPGQMPVFRFSRQDQDAVASYVDYLQRAEHPGGLSIGGIGPVPEGFVAWVLGMALLLAVVYLIGRRWQGPEQEPVDR
ncbi:MAG TPA: c-type cytochrome [candidate division Zixibacteria bacterium]|nr:c-type cytochrome [candidate division Zixibacteria bacterium]